MPSVLRAQAVARDRDRTTGLQFPQSTRQRREALDERLHLTWSPRIMENSFRHDHLHPPIPLEDMEGEVAGERVFHRCADDAGAEGDLYLSFDGSQDLFGCVPMPPAVVAAGRHEITKERIGFSCLERRHLEPEGRRVLFEFQAAHVTAIPHPDRGLILELSVPDRCAARRAAP